MKPAMKFSCMLSIFLTTPGCATADHDSGAGSCTGIWSASATSLYPDAGDSISGVHSPDGNTRIFAGTQGALIEHLQSKTAIGSVALNPGLSEALWAADSRHFAINSSDGGIVGSWDFSIFYLNDAGHMTQIKASAELKLATNTLPDCEEPEVANLGVATWLDNGEHFLVVAEAPPHSSCHNMGEIRGFKLSSRTGEIIEQISDQSLRSDWSPYLGCRFELRK